MSHLSKTDCSFHIFFPRSKHSFKIAVRNLYYSTFSTNITAILLKKRYNEASLQY